MPLAKAMNGNFVPFPTWDGLQPFISRKLGVTHPLGGCPIGGSSTDARRSGLAVESGHSKSASIRVVLKTPCNLLILRPCSRRCFDGLGWPVCRPSGVNRRLKTPRFGLPKPHNLQPKICVDLCPSVAKIDTLKRPHSSGEAPPKPALKYAR